jgi:aminoglycoside phosphotransferase (APT) family kinase protein
MLEGRTSLVLGAESGFWMDGRHRETGHSSLGEEWRLRRTILEKAPMIAGAPDEARWIRPEPRRTLPAALLERIVHTAFPSCRAVEAQPFADGLRNGNFKLQLDSTAEAIVLRMYEHDSSICQKEADLIRLVGSTVPVPEVIHVEPRGWQDIPPFTLMRYVEGISFRELKIRGDREAIAEAAYSAGQTLAAISRITFAKSGWLGPGPKVTAPLLEGADPLPRFIDLCLASTNLQERVPASLRGRIHTLVWSLARQLRHLDDAACLVHGDFGTRNLLVRNVTGKWCVAAVLDWEFAVSGSPLIDLGHFLRYERVGHPVAEPHFSGGYLHAGGTLPQDWSQVARIVDLPALCESLTHEYLPGTIVRELVDLVRGTVENRDPH